MTAESIINSALETEMTPMETTPVPEVTTDRVESRDGEMDDELRRILESRKAEIKVVGVGGGGGNTISRLMQVGIVGAETVAVNTDAQDLLYTDADRKILIGKDITGGLGAGGLGSGAA